MLEEQGFEPRPRDGGALLGNCPFRELAHAHPRLVCEMNLGLVEGIVAGSELRARLDSVPGHCCVRVVRADDAQDVTPSLVEGVRLPVHTLAITALGIDILDNQDLEAVAGTAARLNRWEFLLTVAPVPVLGGTGFPINALAIF